jgi:hypothetical protein
MPFTAAHVAAVMPLVSARERLRLDATCLVIGSMAPDFEYFIRGRQASSFSHTMVGLFLWGLPITLVLGMLYHRVFKWPTLLVLPRRIAERAVGAFARGWPPPRSLGASVSLLVSALIGNVSHVGWDSFTHHDGWIVKHTPALAIAIPLPLGGGMTVYRALQHGSTVVGLVILMVLGWRWLRRQAPQELPPAPRAIPRAVAALALALGILLADARIWLRPHRSPGDIVVATIAGALWGAVFAGLFLRERAQKLERQSASPV